MRGGSGDCSSGTDGLERFLGVVLGVEVIITLADIDNRWGI